MSEEIYMEELSVKQLIDKYNFIVPEIQREYVWGNNDFHILDTFYDDLQEKKEKAESLNEAGFLQLQETLATVVGRASYQEEAISILEKALAGFEANTDINIGFLYSYKPNYYVYNDVSQDVYLIDGQQRFTTLFLSLFFFAVGEQKTEDFEKRFRINIALENLGFDYRVRSYTHRFLLELIKHTHTLDDFRDLTQKTWFLADYNDDVTIKAFIGTIKTLYNRFHPFPIGYYTFLMNKVRFWHFKTEETFQGEELYITMNSRGRTLTDHEKLRAKLFENKENNHRRAWGIEWEKWQDLFWVNKDRRSSSDNDSTQYNYNENADIGFNEFLLCIAGLESYLQGHTHHFVDHQKYIDEGLSTLETAKILSLPTIKKYVDALVFLEEHKSAFSAAYSYSLWINKCLNLIWDLFNYKRTNWFVQYTDDARSTERNRMVFIWSVLYYLSDYNGNLAEAYRVLRLYYLRYHNNDRSVSNLKERVNRLLQDGLFNTTEQYITREERVKINWLKNIHEEELLNAEALIWKLEDHPLNLDGELGAANSSHLVDYDANPSIPDIEGILEKFDCLFPQAAIKYNERKLQSILLFYGSYWMDRKATYYLRYKFDEWKRIIRNRDGKNKPFGTFFKAYQLNDDLDKLLDQLKNEFLEDKRADILTDGAILPEMELQDQLIIYYILLGDSIWDKGNYIAIYQAIETLRLFVNEKNKIYNSNGEFRSSAKYADLWEECQRKFQSPLGHLKAICAAEKMNA